MDYRGDPPRFARGFTEISGQFAAWRTALAPYRRDNETSGAGGVDAKPGRGARCCGVSPAGFASVAMSPSVATSADRLRQLRR